MRASVAYDLFGWAAVRLEWGLSYYLCAEREMLSRDKIRGIYDGSIFTKIAQERQDKNNNRSGK